MTSISKHTPCCLACGYGSHDLVAERGWVRSNVRAFRDEQFEVWRCRYCASLHASEEVELAHYYSAYPFHKLQSDARMLLLYDNQVRRLTKVGLKYAHRILDYGCGGGAFVRHLRKRGFVNAFGYDRFSVDYANEDVLQRTYDVVLAQDVLEHVPEPAAFFSRLSELVAPGGIIAIGTPNAEALDLAQPVRYSHALHLPYHRHIFSKRALVSAGERYGWRLIRYYPRQYANTLVPFLNASFYLYYMRLRDNTLDSLIEPPRILPLLWRIPLTLFWGLLGYFLSEETDVMAIYRDSRSQPSAARQKSGSLLAPLRGAATPPRPSSLSRGFTPNPAVAARPPSAAVESQQLPALFPASGTSAARQKSGSLLAPLRGAASK